MQSALPSTAGAAVGGVTVSATGVGAVAGAPVAVTGAVIAAEGTILGVSGASSFGSQKGRLDASGKSKGTTPEKQQNLKDAESKGIPKNQLGPSGKPKIHTVEKPNMKQAKDAARNSPKSNTAPEKHSSDKGQKTHYHSTRNGEKMKGKNNVHYVNKSTKKNPD